MNARTVLVSGGGTGIGRAVAHSFAADGDSVVLIGRRQQVLDEAAEKIGGDVRALSCDLSDPADVLRTKDLLPDRVDVLINSAGSNALLQDGPADDLAGVHRLWMQNLTANVMSTVLLTHVVADRMGQGGRIVALSSSAARTGAPGSHGYGAAKAAVEAWVRAMSQELGPRGITVNGIAPSLIDDTDFFPSGVPDELLDRLAARSDNRRVGRTADVVNVIRFLVADETSHTTGHVVPVDGGVTFVR
jgi:3-oxoacyl-[acyl-carrier protein] reductase